MRTLLHRNWRVARDEAGRRTGGFTLLEVMFALLLLVILMGGIYSIADGAIQLGSEVAESQNREMLVHSFLQLCRRNIESLPGNGQMTLLAERSGRFYVTEVAFINAPLAFSFAAVPAGYDKAVLQSQADPRGWVNVNLRYFNEEDEESLTAAGIDEEEGITLPLLERVSVFEWRFYDQDEEEWMVVWDDEQARPSFIELTLGFFDGSEPVRTVFWVPPVANPEQVLAAGGAGGGGQAGPGGGAAAGGGAGAPGGGGQFGPGPGAGGAGAAGGGGPRGGGQNGGGRGAVRPGQGGGGGGQPGVRPGGQPGGGRPGGGAPFPGGGGSGGNRPRVIVP